MAPAYYMRIIPHTTLLGYIATKIPGVWNSFNDNNIVDISEIVRKSVLLYPDAPPG